MLTFSKSVTDEGETDINGIKQLSNKSLTDEGETDINGIKQ